MNHLKRGKRGCQNWRSGKPWRGRRHTSQKLREVDLTTPPGKSKGETGARKDEAHGAYTRHGRFWGSSPCTDLQCFKGVQAGGGGLWGGEGPG